MKVENMKNYGKGFIELNPELNKLKKQIIFPMAKTLFREIGLSGIIKFIWQFSKETKKLKGHNWSGNIEKHRFSKNNVNLVIEDIVMMKVLVDMVGENKALNLMSEMLKNANSHIYPKNGKNLLLIPVEDIKACEDRFVCFKEFLKAGEKTIEQEGVHQVEIIEDSDSHFAFDVKFCVLHELAKELGNPKFCFLSCQVDDVVLPVIGSEIGFQYMRPSTLSCEGSKCEFRFKRI